MSNILFNNRSYACRDRETVLDTFLRNGVNVPFSCKNGVCHACLLRSIDTQPPAASQLGIKATLADKNYFLSCKCIPERDMHIELPRSADLLTRAVLADKQLLAPDICRLLIDPATQVYYHAGQFINLHGPDQLVRSYSLASVPSQDYYLELHVRRVAGGKMSGWIFDSLKAGDEIEFHGPLGECYFKSGDELQNLLLVSTGTGLAPHFGIIRDAMEKHHLGDIFLYQGSSDESGHYLRPQLAELASRFPNFRYLLCTDAMASQADVVTGQVAELAFNRHSHLQDWLIYLSGNPDVVRQARELALQHGAEASDIYSDPFEYNSQDVASTKLQGNEESHPVTVDEERRKFPDPDPEMWAALDNGKLMTAILTSFYDRVFEDDLLSPYFVGVTKQRLIEKVYNFLYQMYTGEKVYFGERPRNLHHWMVIPEETFDYREKLMEQCLREHGLAEHLIRRWLDYEYLYKDDIVKNQPINKIVFGEEVPYEGFDTLVMEFSSLCDSCGGEINVGETVRYHVRMGTTWCARCAGIE